MLSQMIVIFLTTFLDEATIEKVPPRFIGLGE